jgi:hypothetical protein
MIRLTSNPGTGKILARSKIYAGIAQLVEHATENCGVHSSILCPGTPNDLFLTNGVIFVYHAAMRPDAESLLQYPNI